MGRMMIVVKNDYLRVLAVLLAIVLATLLSAAIMVQTAPPAVADDSRCAGLLTGPHDNVVVPPGATCVLNNAQVKGNVKALEDSQLFSISGTTVQGSVFGDKAEVVQFSNSTVRGNIEIKEGEVNDQGLLDVFLQRTTVQEGNVKIEKMTGEVLVINNDVHKGNLQLFENLPAAPAGMRVLFNEVAQDLQVFKNRGPATKQVAGNTVGENLQCFENDPPFIGQSNVAKKAEGQCGATQSSSSASVESMDAAQDEELEAAMEENQRAVDSMLEEAKAAS